MSTDWDDAYENAAYISGADQLLKKMVKDAAAYRKVANGNLDIWYGLGEREKYDLFLPVAEPKGLVVFIHGGYWLDFDKSTWSHLAAGCVKNGWAVCVPSYDLCPDVHISDITRQVGAAIMSASAIVAGPINISGHSAGGHLAARMGCKSTPLSNAAALRVKNIIGISGLYDLGPLRRTKMNDVLKLSNAEVKTESPALLEPLAHISFTSWVGSIERPEFIRQSKKMAKAWVSVTRSTDYVEAQLKHHFNVFSGLSDADSDLVQKLLA